MSASGVFMPPMLIFPRVKENVKFLEGKPDGAWAEWHKSGWIQTELFTKWFKEFIKFSHASLQNPVLLLLDGHVSHVKNLEVAKLGKENGVTILCFPPHCTHRMQPLDVSFMKPLSNCYSEVVKEFRLSGRQVMLKDLFCLFGKAWQKAAKIETAVNSFKVTGIFPLNVKIFDPHFESLSNSCLDSASNESSVNIAQYNEVINNIMSETSNAEFSPAPPNQNSVNNESPASNSSSVINNSNLDAVRSVSSTLNMPMAINETSQDIVNTILSAPKSTVNDTSQNSAEAEVRIPISYILQAQPLISLLVSCLINVFIYLNML